MRSVMTIRNLVCLYNIGRRTFSSLPTTSARSIRTELPQNGIWIDRDKTGKIQNNTENNTITSNQTDSEVVLSGIIKKFIDGGSYEIAITALRRIYNSGNSKFIENLPRDTLLLLIKKTKKDINLNPEKYTWFLKIILWNNPLLSIKDVIYICKCFIRINASHEVYKIIRNKKDFIKKECPHAIYTLFDACVEANNSIVANHIIENLFDYEYHYKQAHLRNFKVTKRVNHRFIKCMIPKLFLKKVTKSSISHHLKSILFVCKAVEGYLDPLIIGALVEFAYHAFYRNNVDLQKHRVENELPLLEECERILYKYMFTPELIDYSEDEISGAIDRYIKTYKESLSTTFSENSAEVPIRAHNTNSYPRIHKKNKNYCISKLLLAFAYACKNGNSKLTFDSFNHLSDFPELQNDKNFILACLYHSKLSKESMFVIASKLLTVNNDTPIWNDTVVELSELAAIFETDELLLKILHTLTSNSNARPCHFYILTAAAVRKNKLDFVKSHLMSYVGIPIYSYIQELSYKLDVAVNILKIVDISSQEAHFAEILSWDHVEETVKYILFSLINDNFPERAAVFFSMSLNYYPNLIDIINTQVLVDLINVSAQSSSKMISLFSKFVIGCNQKSPKVMSAIESLVIPIKRMVESEPGYAAPLKFSGNHVLQLCLSNFVSSDNHTDEKTSNQNASNEALGIGSANVPIVNISNDSLKNHFLDSAKSDEINYSEVGPVNLNDNKDKLETNDVTHVPTLVVSDFEININSIPIIVKLLTYALSDNCLRFTEYITPMMKYIIKCNLFKLALDFLIDIHNLAHNTIPLLEPNDNYLYSKSVLRTHVVEAYVILCEKLLDYQDFENIKLLLQATSTRDSLFRTILPSSGLTFSGTIAKCVTSSTVKNDNDEVYINPNYVVEAKKIALILYDIVKMDTKNAQIALSSIEELMSVTKISTTFSKDSALGCEFDKSMHDAIVCISKKESVNYTLHIQNCVRIFLEKSNLALVSKNYTIVDPLSLKLIISQILNFVISEKDSCLIFDNLSPEAIAIMQLTSGELGILLQLFVKYRKINYGFMVIKEIVEKTPSKKIQIKSIDLALFIDACLINDYVHIVDSLMSMNKLLDSIDVKSKMFIDVNLKYLVCRHRFAEAGILLDKATIGVKSDLLDIYIGHLKKGLLVPVEDISRSNIKQFEDRHIKDTEDDTKNHKNTSFRPSKPNNDSPESQFLNFYSSSKFRNPTFIKFSHLIRNAKANLNFEISIPTLIYTLRMCLLLEQQDTIYSFLKYVYAISPLLPPSTLNEFLRCFVESRNYRSSFIMTSIIYNVGHSIPVNAIINLFTCFLNDGNFTTAWKFFNIVCILSQDKSLSEAKGKKMIIDLYTAVLPMRGQGALMVKSGIEALNSRKQYIIEFDINHEMKKAFLFKSFFRIDHSSQLPSSYRVKKFVLDKNKKDYVLSKYILSNHEFVYDRARIANTDSAVQLILEIYQATYGQSGDRDLLIYKYYLLLLKMYEGEYTNEEYLSSIICRLCDEEQRDIVYCILRAGTYLNFSYRNWYVRSLGYLCETHLLKVWFSVYLLSTYHRLKMCAPKRLVEYMVFNLSESHDIIANLRRLVKNKLYINENLLYTLYINQINDFVFYKDTIKIFKRLLLLVVNGDKKSITYKTLEMYMDMCKLSSDYNGAMRIWSLLVGHYRISPSLKCYDLLMETFINAGQIEAAQSVLYNLIKESQIPRDKYNKTHVMVLIKADMPVQAIEIAFSICNAWREAGMYLPAPLGPPELTELIYRLCSKRLNKKANDARSLTYIFGYRKELLRPYWSSLANKLIDDNDFETLDIFVSVIGINSLGIWGMDTLVRVLISFVKCGHRKNAESILRYINVDMRMREIDPKLFEEVIRAYECFIPSVLCSQSIRRALNALILHHGALPSRDTLLLVARKMLDLNDIDGAEYIISIIYDSGLEVPMDMLEECIYRWIDTGFYDRALRMLQYLISLNFDFNEKLIFALAWSYYKKKNIYMVEQVLKYLISNGYSFKTVDVTDTLLRAAVSNMCSEDAFKEWSSVVFVPYTDNNPPRKLAFTNLYQYAYRNKPIRAILPNSTSFADRDTSTIKMHPRLSTTKNIWKIRDTNLNLETGLIPPDYLLGRYRKLYELDVHSKVKRRKRVGRTTSVKACSINDNSYNFFRGLYNDKKT